MELIKCKGKLRWDYSRSCGRNQYGPAPDCLQTDLVRCLCLPLQSLDVAPWLCGRGSGGVWASTGISPAAGGASCHMAGVSLLQEPLFGTVVHPQQHVICWHRCLSSHFSYLLFSCSPQASTGSRRLFLDLVQRCLCTVPSRLEVPFNPAEFWSCYHFHNKARLTPACSQALTIKGQW